MDFLKGLFGAKKNAAGANIRMNNRKNMVPAPAANMMVVAPPAPVPANAPQQFGGRKRTRKNKKNRKARKASRKNRKASC
jgi:DNA-directed RNA polymerase